MLKFLKSTKEKLLNALFPNNKCILCGRDIPDFDNSPICDTCLKLDLFNDGNRCQKCDLQIPDDNKFCDYCMDNKFYFEKAYCPLLYKGSVRKMILKFKSDNARYLARPCAQLIYKRLQESDVKFDIIIAVPAHQKVTKSRGYNQSQLLATELAKLLDVPCLDNVVIKDKMTKKQKGLKIAERKTNVSTCFKLIDKAVIKNKNILIVDDIMTTGYTINAVAKELSKSAKHIYACAIARNPLKK